MSRLRLPRRWTDYLLTQPETGMGFQRVAVRLRNGRTLESALVFNAEELETGEPARLGPDDILEIRVQP